MNAPAPKIAIIGGGLAGSEAALQLAKRGIAVTLFEMKPVHRSPAHHSNDFAEIVCSNSFGNLKRSTASGLLKEELRMMDCQLIQTADKIAVPAGNALAVDRDRFSQEITRLIASYPTIEHVAQDVSQLPEGFDFIIMATGPLTTPGLAETMQNLLKQKQLYFFDAASPIVTTDSINFDVAFYQNRYDQSATEEKGTAAGSYINCPFDKEQYLRLIEFLIQAEKIPLKDFEKENAQFFESCMPIEVLASRGIDTPRYGPMKPVGIIDPRTGKQPYAVVQLRQDNLEGTLYNIVGFQTNLKWGEQKTMMELIPGLEHAEVIRYGVMHRNTYLNSPEVLLPTMQLKAHPHILIAGQLTGVEGYTECIASGLRAALTVVEMMQGRSPSTYPEESMMGALFNYITRPGVKNFQPINSNWGILPQLPQRIRDKQMRNEQFAQRALSAMEQFIAQHPNLTGILPVSVR